MLKVFDVYFEEKNSGSKVKFLICDFTMVMYIQCLCQTEIFISKRFCFQMKALRKVLKSTVEQRAYCDVMSVTATSVSTQHITSLARKSF